MSILSKLQEEARRQRSEKDLAREKSNLLNHIRENEEKKGKKDQPKK